MQFYGNDWVEELEKLAKSLCEMIKCGHFERDVDPNSIKTSLRCLIENESTMCKESFAKAFIGHLKVIRASHYENELKKLENRQSKHMKEHKNDASISTLRGCETTMSNVKAGSECSVASS